MDKETTRVTIPSPTGFEIKPETRPWEETPVGQVMRLSLPHPTPSLCFVSWAPNKKPYSLHSSYKRYLVPTHPSHTGPPVRPKIKLPCLFCPNVVVPSWSYYFGNQFYWEKKISVIHRDQDLRYRILNSSEVSKIKQIKHSRMLINSPGLKLHSGPLKFVVCIS